MYKILESSNLEDLEEQVNEKINQGWKLQGGVAVTEFRFIQAITIRYTGNNS